MNKIKSQILLLIGGSFIISYVIYVYILQPPSFFSRSRLMIASLIWIFLFFVGYILLRKIFPGSTIPLKNRQFWWGVVGIFLFINLAIAGILFDIPYTYILLPTQTVEISPGNGQQTIELMAFTTELTEGISLENFYVSDGWNSENRVIAPNTKQVSNLVWRGKPGQFIELTFRKCHDCGSVNIVWNSDEEQEIALSDNSSGQYVRVSHSYPSLIGHKILNFVFLQIAVFVLSFALSSIWWLIYKNENKPTRLKQNKENELFTRIYPWIGLFILTVIVFSLNIQPILHNDDWCDIIERLNSPVSNTSMILGDRPLQWVVPLLFHQLMSLDRTVYAIYYAQVFVLFINAGLVYTLINRLNSNQRWFSFLSASLFLVYPNEYTSLYITMIGIRIGQTLTLLVLILLDSYFRTEKLWYVFILLPMMVSGLLMFEAQLGLLAIWPLLMLFIHRDRISLRKVIGIAAYYLSLGVYLIWKVFVQSTGFIEKKQGYLSIGIPELVNRYLNSLHIILGGFTYDLWGLDLLSAKNILTIIFLLFYLIVSYAYVTYLFDSGVSTFGTDKSLKKYIFLLIVGILLLVAGYFPIIMNYPPNIYGVLSRVNLFSNLGVVIIIPSLICIICIGLRLSFRHSSRSIAFAVLLLILWGSAIQLDIQTANISSWRETKIFYNQLFEEVPNLKNGTQVVLLLDGYDENQDRYRPLFASFWEPKCAFWNLYANDDLDVYYRYHHYNVSSFPTLNVISNLMFENTIPRINNFANLIVLEYDHASKQLDIREKIDGLFEGATNSDYAPNELIIPPDKKIIERKLVE